MKICFPALLLLFTTTFLSAQVSDDFSDLNFNSNPVWVGDDTFFVVNTNAELQSNGPQATSTLYLSTPNALINSAEWNFLIKLTFNPSSTNYVRAYLVSDQANLKGTLNGYFVQLGEAGTAPDSIDIFRQTGTAVTKVFTGISGCMSNAAGDMVRIKIIRSNAGLWKVYADCTGGTNYSFEGQFTDNTFTATGHFGFYCRYATASRFDKFFFDDVAINFTVADTIKPVVQSATAVSSLLADIKFSEAVDAATAQNVLNYSVNNGIGNPLTAQRDASDFSLVHLTLTLPLQSATNYNITIQNIADLSGNQMITAVKPLAFFVPAYGDVVINEIMADPTPQVNLPNGEFIELKNKNSFDINLNNWTFSDASTTVTITNTIIPADSFIVLCANSLVDSFAARGFTNIIIKGLSSLPSLNNSSDSLKLKDNNGNLIDEVNYSDTWYRDAVKKNGGWTLERIDPNTTCGGILNWMASADANGGTPGKQNSVSGTYIDNTKPVVVFYEILSSTTIKLVFSEPVNAAEATNTLNYMLNNGIGNPQSVSLNGNEVILTLNDTLSSSLSYLLTIQNISDCMGNVMLPATITIAFPVIADVNDVIITEIFADPDPVVGLPNAEFVELFNRSNKVISLTGWIFNDAASSATLPSKLLLPQEYVILCSNSSASLFAPFGDVISVSSLPSLNNSGDTLTLKDNSGRTIHNVIYSDTWYNNNIKKAGGWTLEMIDTENPCSGAANWKASEAAQGGTPGMENSVSGINADSRGPSLLYVLVEDSRNIILIFDESLDSAGIAGVNQFVFAPNNISAASFLTIAPSFNEIRITLNNPLIPKSIYTVTASGITDCSGNVIVKNTAQFGLPESPESGDVIINEILFNPESFGSDFVELYNNSDKIIDLKSLIIAEADYTKQDSVTEFTRASSRGFLLLPGNYVAITPDPSYINTRYFSENPDNVLLAKSLPTYPDKDGVFVLLDTLLKTIDKVAYSETSHYPMIDDKNGVSLERITFNGLSQDKNNWHSAASTVGFATPAYKNSQAKDETDVNEYFTINPEAFSPDNDGYNDFMNIIYSFDEPGWTATIKIFDAVGRPIRDLINNELLALEGTIQWNGTTDEGKKARIGIHIVFIELFNPNGDVKRYKRSCVVAGKID
jgi:hypothetical protein